MDHSIFVILFHVLVVYSKPSAQQRSKAGVVAEPALVNQRTTRLGINLNITCPPLENNETAIEKVQWYTREGVLIGDTGDIKIHGPLGETIEILDVTHPDDSGIYYCQLKSQKTGKQGLFSVGINMRGPIYLNLLDEKSLNLTIAIAVAGTFVGLSAAACIIYNWRLKKSLKKEAHSLQKQPEYDTFKL